MAHLAIIVLAIIATFSNKKLNEKFNFSGIVVKAAESQIVWFCSLLQTSWAAEKVQ